MGSTLNVVGSVGAHREETLLETSPLASRGSDVNVITVHTSLLHKKREMLSNALQWQFILYSQLTEIMKSKVTDTL